MDHFGHQSERLQRAGTEFLQQQQFGEVVKITFVGYGEHCAKPLEVHIRRADLVMWWHTQMAGRIENVLRMLPSDTQQGALRRSSMCVHEIHDRALVLADYSGVRLDN